MQIGEDERTTFIKLGDGENLQLKTVTVNKSPSEADVIKRYHLQDFEICEPIDSLKARANATAQMAKRVFQADGYHAPMLFLEGPKGIEFSILLAEDSAEKGLQWLRIARKVESTGAESLIFITEAWLTSASKAEKFVSKLRSEKRKECLTVVAASASGEEAILSAEILGGWFRKPILGSFEEMESGILFFLEPVRDVWRKSKQAGTRLQEK